jgi:hypothetical protein
MNTPKTIIKYLIDFLIFLSIQNQKSLKYHFKTGIIQRLKDNETQNYYLVLIIITYYY